MKEKTLYVCEFCGTKYEDKRLCEKCEQNHKSPREVTAGKYSPVTVDRTGYPKTVKVYMSDGVTVEYKR